MTPLEEALAHTRTWLSHHYEVEQETRGAHSAVVVGNTPGTAAIAGEAFYVLVETLESIDHGFTARHLQSPKELLNCLYPEATGTKD